MGNVPDDPFWPPDPDDLEEVVVGESPYVLLQVVRGPIPAPGGTDPFVIELHCGGGLDLDSVPYLLRAVVNALEVGDMGIAVDGTLIRRSEAPPRPQSPPGPPGSPPTDRL